MGWAKWPGKLAEQTGCANWLGKLPVQTGWACWLGKLAGQTAPAGVLELSMAKLTLGSCACQHSGAEHGEADPWELCLPTFWS